MVRVFKTSYVDRKGKTSEAAKWYVEFRDHNETIRRLPAFTDRKQKRNVRPQPRKAGGRA